MYRLDGLFRWEKGFILHEPIHRSMLVVLCNDAEIEVPDGEVCQICGFELDEYDQVTGTAIFGYYHWTCISHVD